MSSDISSPYPVALLGSLLGSTGAVDRRVCVVERPSWATDDVDLSRPSVARVYDFFLGGSHHFEVDRQMAARMLEMAPDTAEVMRSNRSFLRRVVRFMAAEGITQYLDIG